MKTMLISVVLMASSFFVSDPITGRWESKPSPNGNVTGILFKGSNSFEGYVNKKPFVTGTYTFEDGIFSFTDNGCNGAKGVYKLIFFSSGDSLRFEPISDSCTERKEGMIRLIMGKVK
jgi:hypothetical protein